MRILKERCCCMKKRINKKGHSNYEFLMVSIICLLLSTIILVIAIKSGDAEKFEVFRYNAKILGLNAITLEDESSLNTIYLQDMVDKGLISSIKNPFGGTTLCNQTESKVEFTTDGKKVTLQCGNYLIYKQKLSDKTYSIYRVSNWSIQRMTEDDDSKKVYNIKEKNKTIFEDNYEEAMFVAKVNNYYNEDYKDLTEIKKAHKVTTKTVYRQRIKVGEVNE